MNQKEADRLIEESKNPPTMAEIKAQIRKGGTKVFGIVTVTSDDTICVEIKKSSVLAKLKGWTDDDYYYPINMMQILENGDVLL